MTPDCRRDAAHAHMNVCMLWLHLLLHQDRIPVRCKTALALQAIGLEDFSRFVIQLYRPDLRICRLATCQWPLQDARCLGRLLCLHVQSHLDVVQRLEPGVPKVEQCMDVIGDQVVLRALHNLPKTSLVVRSCSSCYPCYDVKITQHAEIRPHACCITCTKTSCAKDLSNQSVELMRPAAPRQPHMGQTCKARRRLYDIVHTRPYGMLCRPLQ